MADDWKSTAFRQRIIAQLEELIRQTPAGNQKSAHDLEHQVFQRSSKRDEYLQYIGRLVSHMREVAQSNTNPQTSNPQLAAVLAGQQVPAGQMVGTPMTGPIGPVTGGPNATIITGQNIQNLQGGPRMGQPMMPNLPNQASDIPNWAGNNHQRLSDIQMGNVNKKQQGITINQMSGQPGKINTIQMTIGQNMQTPQIGQFTGQMVGRGGGPRQPRVPSPGFPSSVQAVPRQGTPTPSSASPAPPLSAPSNLVSPSPSSNMVPSPAGPNSAGMGRGASHIGAPSPGGIINTPGQIQQPSPAAQGMTNSQAEEAAYREKVRQLSKYVDPLRRMIQRIGNEDAEKSCKMKQLHDMLQNPQRRMPMETLLKCEQVLEKLEIHRDAEVPPSMENRIAGMTESVTNALKSPCAAHTLHRTISPALSVLLGPNLTTNPIKPVKRDNPLQPPPETPNISDVIQGEVARLNARFRVNLDCQQPPGSDDLTLICQLDDPNLPCVPPITLTVPAGYPLKPPRCDLLAVDYETTDFLKSARKSMMVRLRNMPPHCSLTMMLHSWEMSVRQACSPKQSVTSAVASALAMTAGF